MMELGSIISFWLLAYMCSHVYYMSGDAWKEGGIDATGQHILIYYCQLTLILFLLMLIFSCIV